MSEDTQDRMVCMEVWGGSQLTNKTVELGGMDAWVYSKPYAGATRGGDVYYASKCGTGRISRILLADVSGHGKDVAVTAADLRTLMRRYVNYLDQSEFVKSMNRQFGQLSKSGSFATALVSTFFAPTNRLTLCNAGHPRPLRFCFQKKSWAFVENSHSHSAKPADDHELRNLPLGILDLTDYETIDVELNPGDVLVFYTDALIESRDADGEFLGEEGLLRILNLIGDVPSAQLVDAILAEIGHRFPQNLSDDDTTILVLSPNGKMPAVTFGEKIRAAGRFISTLVRSINPRAERAPFPDMTLANVGGAVIPALSKRWKAKEQAVNAKAE